MQSIIGGRNGCQARVRLNIVKEKFYLSDYAWHASACTCNSYFQRIEELEGFCLAINSGTVLLSELSIPTKFRFEQITIIYMLMSAPNI